MATPGWGHLEAIEAPGWLGALSGGSHSAVPTGHPGNVHHAPQQCLLGHANMPEARGSAKGMGPECGL